MLASCRFGPLFTDFDKNWTLRTTQQFMQECLPLGHNPLADVQGFSVSMLCLGIWVRGLLS